MLPYTTKKPWFEVLSKKLRGPACATLSERQKDAIEAWVRQVVSKMQIRMAPLPPFDPSTNLPFVPFLPAHERDRLSKGFGKSIPCIQEWLPFLCVRESDAPTGLTRTALDLVVARLVETRRLENAIANPPQLGFREFGDDDDDTYDMPPSHPVLRRQDALEGPTFLGGMFPVPLVRTPAPAYNMRDLRRQALDDGEGSQAHGC